MQEVNGELKSGPGPIANTGGLHIVTGTETLAGVNSYTGATNHRHRVAAEPGRGRRRGAILAGRGKRHVRHLRDQLGRKRDHACRQRAVVLGSQTLNFTAGSTTFAGSMSGTGGLVAAGGVQALSGTNVYSGITTINSGAGLALIGRGSIAASVSVVDNGMFDTSRTTNGASIMTLDGGGVVQFGAQTLTLTNASTTFAGVINGTGGLAINGGGKR